MTGGGHGALPAASAAGQGRSGFHQGHLFIFSVLFSTSSSCRKCEPVEIELGGQIYKAQQSTSCDEPETCYTYDRDKCYTTTFPFSYQGEIRRVQAALTPTSCYKD